MGVAFAVVYLLHDITCEVHNYIHDDHRSSGAFSFLPLVDGHGQIKAQDQKYSYGRKKKAWRFIFS